MEHDSCTPEQQARAQIDKKAHSGRLGNPR